MQSTMSGVEFVVRDVLVEMFVVVKTLKGTRA
jgi:hypothetical protein